MHRRLATLLVLPVLAAVVAGCGGGPPDVADVRSCLKEIKDVDVQEPPKAKDKDIEDGVIGVRQGSSGEEDGALIAIGARTRTEKQARTFERDTQDAYRQITGEKGAIKSGRDGKYIWVVIAPDKGADDYEAALACVEA